MNFLASLIALALIMGMLVALAYLFRPTNMPESEFRAALFGPLKKRLPDDLHSITMTLSRIGLVAIAYPLACSILPVLNFFSLSRETFVMLIVAGGTAMVGSALYRQRRPV